jgi:hypothetical protein
MLSKRTDVFRQTVAQPDQPQHELTLLPGLTFRGTKSFFTVAHKAERAVRTRFMGRLRARTQKRVCVFF